MRIKRIANAKILAPNAVAVEIILRSGRCKRKGDGWLSVIY
jgi:hypothetical protein